METDTLTRYLNIGTDNKGFFSRHRHTLIMVLGCTVPILLLVILWAAGVSQNILYFGILLLCPIMHLLMMRNINHGTHHPQSQIDYDKKEEIK